MLKKFIIVVLFLGLVACSDPEGARKALLDDGIEPTEVGGYGWWSCDKNDTFSTRFTGKRANGRVVSGTVCSGWFKGHTIRYD